MTDPDKHSIRTWLQGRGMRDSEISYITDREISISEEMEGRNHLGVVSVCLLQEEEKVFFSTFLTLIS